MTINGRWRPTAGVSIDTDIEPDWQRTGYRYFPYAACQDGQWWVVRANFCFPEHDFTTLFIDGAAVAEVTAAAGDGRPLVASIGRLSMTHPQQRTAGLPLMRPAEARYVVGRLARFVDHGSEWGQPCDLCEFADRDPFAAADT